MTGRDHDPRPRVALVAHEVHDEGGMERACAELVRRASDRYQFTIVAARIDRELLPIADWIPVRVPPRPIPLRMVTFAAVAGGKLRDVHADLVHTVGAVVPNRCDLATVHMCHAGVRDAMGLAPAAATLPRRINTGLAHALAIAGERWCYRPGRLGALAAVSRGVADELERHHPAVPVTVTPNGVDPERFHPDPATRAAVRRRHDLDPDDLVALFVGGDWARKGLDVAIGAVASADGRSQRWRLWVVGRGDESRYRRLAAGCGIGDRVAFFGHRNDPGRFYRAADVFLLPTQYETFSLVSYEAAACGLPVVAPPVSGIEDLIGDGRAGVAVDRDPESIAAALHQLTDNGTRTRLGEQARRRARGYTWDRSVQCTTAVYRRLLSAGETDVPEGA